MRGTSRVDTDAGQAESWRAFNERETIVGDFGFGWLRVFVHRIEVTGPGWLVFAYVIEDWPDLLIILQ